MEWYYAVDGQQRGPVSDEQLQELARQGVVTGQTLVWHTGLATWQPCSSVGNGVTAWPAGQAHCAECGRALPEAAMIRYGNLWICAQCKPVFLQRLQEGANLPGQEIWRAGKKLVMRKDATLPPRCVKCNAPADGPGLKRNLSWHPPLLVLLILISLLVYIVVVLLVRKQAKIVVGLCSRHWAARRQALLIAWSLFGAALLLFAAAAYFENGWTVFAGALTLLVCVIYAVVGPRMVYPTRIDKERLWLGGAGRRFLDYFPEWPGR